MNDDQPPEWTRDAALVIWQQMDQITAGRATMLSQDGDDELHAFVERVAHLIASHIPRISDSAIGA